MPYLEERYLAIRDDLMSRLEAVWPELTKVHKVRPELVQGEVPFGWVIRAGPIVPTEGSTRNTDAWRATFSIGGKFNKPAVGTAVEDEQIRLAALLYDNLTDTPHHAEFGWLPEITEILTVEGAHDDDMFEVDLTLAVSFETQRADAV